MLDYTDMLRKQNAALIKECLTHGIKDEHYFYVTIKTNMCKMPQWLKDKYPDQMTFFIQHIFQDLLVYADRFHVTLSFNALWERLEVPYNAVTIFSDPSKMWALSQEAYSLNPVNNEEITKSNVIELLSFKGKREKK